MRGETIHRRKTITVRRYAMREIPGGHTTDFDTYTDTDHEITLEIDIDGLFRRLGDKAARSAGGRAAMGGKLIVARRARR